MPYHILMSCLCILLISPVFSYQFPKNLTPRIIQLKHLSVGNKLSKQQKPLENKLLDQYLRIKSLESSTGVEVPLESTIEPPYALNQAQIVYFVMSSVFITCLLIADIVGVKIFELTLPYAVFGFKTIEHTCGMLTFPLTFLLSDTINEYYGPEATKRTVYVGLWMSILVFFVVNIAQALPYLDRPFNGKSSSLSCFFFSLGAVI
jgi:hypothetical protein